jgi:hypothetical protein
MIACEGAGFSIGMMLENTANHDLYFEYSAGPTHCHKLLIWLYILTDQVDQNIATDDYGRRIMQCIDNRMCTGYIKFHYSSRGLEWSNV